MPPAPNLPCPCHSGVKYKRCCRPFHRGAPAPTPVALMRSRYAAFAIGFADYVMDTTHPEGASFEADRSAWKRSIAQFSAATDFVGLKILRSDESGDEGSVTFRAGLEQAGQDASFTEASRFFRVEGGWLYHSGS